MARSPVAAAAREGSSRWRSPPLQPQPLKNDVHLWCIELHVTAPRLLQLEALLSDDERTRADRFHFARHRRQFVVTRGALRELLAAEIGCQPAALQFNLTRFGKPELEQDLGLWFNVSHSGNLALCALSRVGPVGVDLERPQRLESLERLAEAFFARKEVEALRRQPPQARASCFYTIWTRKEALVKAHGQGLTIPLDAFAVSAEPGSPFELLRWRAEPDAAALSLYDLLVPAPYAGALAVIGRASSLKTWRWQ